MTLEEVLKQGEERLSMAGIEEAKLSAWYLFSHCFEMPRSQYFLMQNELASPEKKAFYEQLLEKREKRIPLEHIIGETEFMGLPFYVNEHVLIPRQDTECLVEEVLKVSEGKEVLDLCAGSGCIGISLSVLGSCKAVTLSDISKEALAVAKRNVERNGAEATLLHSDLFENIQGVYDIIVSNPPYIPTADIKTLMPEVRDFEPMGALDGKEDGLFFYREIVKNCIPHLREHGSIHFEIGYDQGEAVKKLLEEAGFSKVEIKKDLVGLDRIVQGCME